GGVGGVGVRPEAEPEDRAMRAGAPVRRARPPHAAPRLGAVLVARARAHGAGPGKAPEHVGPLPRDRAHAVVGAGQVAAKRGEAGDIRIDRSYGLGRRCRRSNTRPAYVAASGLGRGPPLVPRL